MAQLMPMPAPQRIDPFGSLYDIAQMAMMGESVKRQRAASAQAQEQQRRAQLVEDIYRKTGRLDRTIQELQTAGMYQEADALQVRQGEIRAANQKAAAERMTAQQKAFELSTRYLQGVEAAESPSVKQEMWRAVRPRIVEALPNFDRHVPQEYDPQWVSAAIPIGLSSAEAIARRKEAADAAQADYEAGGKKLARDEDAAEFLRPWMETSETWEDIGEALDFGEDTYGMTPGVRQRIASVFGTMPSGKVTESQRAKLTAAFETPDDEAPDQTVTAQVVRENPSVWRDLTPSTRDKLIEPLQRAGFDFGTLDDPTAQQRREIERFYQDRLSDLDRQYRDPNARMTETDYRTARRRLRNSRNVQLGMGPEPTGPTGRGAQMAERAAFGDQGGQSGAGAPAEGARQLLESLGPGVHDLVDDETGQTSTWRVERDGSMTRVR